MNTELKIKQVARISAEVLNESLGVRAFDGENCKMDFLKDAIDDFQELLERAKGVVQE